ncbi:ribonuclease H-like domain-containing protein, partial [Amylostereum chailletii]
VYTDGSCLGNGSPRAAAGAGIYWGPGASGNTAARVPGAQTNNRGELYAILLATVATPLSRSLKIYTDSQYSTRSIVFWAPRHAACGWLCENGDILSLIAGWILARTAPLALWHIPAHSGNVHGDVSDTLAKTGA